MTLVIVAAMIALTRFASHVTRQPEEPAPADCRGDGTVNRTEVLHVWLPQGLFERPKHQSLEQFLERPGQEHVWYALTFRAHQVDGGFADITIIRHPRTEPEYLPELSDILATAGGNLVSDSNLDLSEAAVHIIAEESAKREPREVIAELLGGRTGPVGRSGQTR
jgi:hypothetical protein